MRSCSICLGKAEFKWRRLPYKCGQRTWRSEIQMWPWLQESWDWEDLVEKNKSLCGGKRQIKLGVKPWKGLSLHPEGKGTHIRSCIFGSLGSHIHLPGPWLLFGLINDLGRMWVSSSQETMFLIFCFSMLTTARLVTLGKSQNLTVF